MEKTNKFISEHNILRSATIIVVRNRHTHETVRVFNGQSAEETEAQLQTFINGQTK